jgi:putative ABC transport system permease protein
MARGMLQSLHHAMRSLRRSPGLTIASVLTIALGISTGTTLFSVVKAVLLSPLPYPRPDWLAWLAETNDSGDDTRIALRNFRDWHEQNHSFSALAAYGDGPVVVGGAMPESTHGAAVTEDFFKVFGVQPFMGRTFSPDEQKPGAALAVLISRGLWQRAYGADPAVLGRSIQVARMPGTIIGVMPAGFSFPPQSEVWVSESALDDNDSRTSHNDWAVGRLRPGVSLEQARQDISGIARRLKRDFPDSFQAKDASTVSLYAHTVGEVRPALVMLFGAVGFLLLIVCVNVANLLLVRATTQARELAVRTALGAPRRRLVGGLIVESQTLALAGGALGLLIAVWSMDLLRVVLPANLPRIADLRIDDGVIVFAIALSVVTGVLAGALPAWRASLVNLNETLKAGARAHTAGRRSRRIQGALIISEVALSSVLLAGATLLLHSFWKLRSIDPGFRAGHVLVAKVAFADLESSRGATVISEYQDILREVQTTPGVESAGLIRDLPLDPIQRDGHFVLQNQRDLPAVAEADYRIISPGYLRALGIPLLRGRDFIESDTVETPGAAIISEEMARRYFPGRDPIGERLWFDSFEPKEHWLTIVGMVKDVRQRGLTAPVAAAAYVCYTQVRPGYLSSSQLVVRTRLGPMALAPYLRSRIRKVNRETAVSFSSMENILDAALSGQRFQTRVLIAFALLALVLAAVGLYGVLSYAVTSHRAEIGIRMALGAHPGEVFRMVTGWAVRLMLCGLALGFTGYLAMQRVLASMVYGVVPSEPAPLIAAAGVLLLVALAASCLPARRAMQIDPIVALHEE